MKKYICFILFSLFSIVSFGQKGHEHRVSGMTGTSPSNQDDTSGIAIDPVMYAGGSNDQPYIITLRPMVKTDSLETLPESGQLQEIQYFNHLGLPTEKIRKGFTPALNDLITLQEYDGMNREIRQWLPTAMENPGGSYVDPSQVQQSARSSELYGYDTYPYSQTIYEGSAEGRIKQQFGPGKDWHTGEKAVCADYLTNSNTEVALNARLYRCSETTLTCSGNYRNGSLRVVKTTDEDGNVSYEFKDKVERLILSRQMNGAEWLDTYYVYDNAGNLRFVLPPLAADVLTGSSGSWNEDNVALKKYAYIYKYDSKNRCIYKKLPGCGPVYTVYDAADRAIFTQDDMQRDKGEWLFSIPDAFGRIVLTGTCKNVLNYSMTPLGSTIIVKATLDKTTNATKGYVVSGITLNTPVILTARLSKTGSVTGYLYSVMYYDDRYRMIQQKGNNELNGTKQTYIAYSFTGQPTEVKQVYAIPGEETITEIRKHTYDHADRLLRTTYQLNNDPLITLVDNVYDEVGRLKSERRNGNPKLKTDYGYNIRSWTRSISGSLFNQTLYYQDQLEGNTPCYNGNISSVLWKAGPSNNESGYRFTYDGLNRMKNAIYGETNSLSVNPNRFNEQITAYDKKGNILGLLRYGQTSSSEYGLIDNLNLTYDGNQLQAVKDNATHSVFGNGMEFKDGANQTIEYAYDKNGNLTKDLNKKIAVIQYNLLNLPSQVSFTEGNVIEYEYGADGRKLRTLHMVNNVTSTTDYCGNAIYENGSLKMLLNEAGYISFPDKKFHFYLKDHQGNIRVVADKDGNVEETNDYYPFGGLFTASTSVQPYKYNGKELDRKNGIDWYDYGARHYDPAIGRFTTVDPMIDKYYPLTPYGYCGGNPICHRDEEGKFINNVVGFFIGGGVDLGIQVAANLVSGNGAFDDIDWVSVGASAVEGGLTSGENISS